VAVNTVKNIAHDLIEELSQIVRYETPVNMGIDEVNLAGGYRCIITNLATNNVFDMLEHRTQEHLKPFFKDLRDADKVEWVCTDMWRPFKRSSAQYLPNAKLVIEKFHVVKMASETLEAERKTYQAQLSLRQKVHSLAHPEAARQPDARRAKGAGGCKAGDPRTCHGLRLQGNLLLHLRRTRPAERSECL
jgi:transposase